MLYPKLRRLFCALALLLPGLLQAQGPENHAGRARVLYSRIEATYYRPAVQRYVENAPPDSPLHYSYLWPLCALLQATNEYEQLTSEARHLPRLMQHLQPYYDTSAPAPGYNSYLVGMGHHDARFYDDNQWVGIACADAFARTKNDVYARQTALVYRFMMTGLDARGGGGLYWKEGDNTTKNTCSNGPGVLVALAMYAQTGQQAYLDTARQLYEWVYERLATPQGLFYDHLRLPSDSVDQRLYTYNAGTMLQSAVRLYEITGKKRYLKQAKATAHASLRQFYRDGFFPGNEWFNAVLLRGYLALYRIQPAEKRYVLAMQTHVNNVWASRQDAQGLLGLEPRKSMLDQAGLLEMLCRLAILNPGGVQ